MGGNMEAIVSTSAWVIASMAYARSASALVKPGKLRLLSLLPVVILLPSLPLRFPSVVLRGASAFFLAWLAVFKLLLLSLGHGPLSPSLPLPSFLAISSFPVHLRPSPLDSSHLFVVSCFQLLGIALLTPLYQHKPLIHPWVLLAVNCIYIYLVLELILASAAFLAGSLLGLALEPQADAPFKSASLQDFWGRRWNLMVTGILRPSVYLPVRSLLGRAAAVMATFLVSGLMHELIFYYMTFEAPTGEVTLFFLIHGLCTAAEVRARRDGWWRLPEYPVVAVPATLGFVAWTAFWLFFPPLLRAGVDEKGVGELAAVLGLVEDGGGAVFRRLNG